MQKKPTDLDLHCLLRWHVLFSKRKVNVGMRTFLHAVFFLYQYPVLFYHAFTLHVLYTERKKKRRVNFIPKFHSSLKKFVKYFTMITKRYMYGTKVPNFIGL